MHNKYCPVRRATDSLTWAWKRYGLLKKIELIQVHVFRHVGYSGKTVCHAGIGLVKMGVRVDTRTREHWRHIRLKATKEVSQLHTCDSELYIAKFNGSVHKTVRLKRSRIQAVSPAYLKPIFCYSVTKGHLNLLRYILLFTAEGPTSHANLSMKSYACIGHPDLASVHSVSPASYTTSRWVLDCLNSVLDVLVLALSRDWCSPLPMVPDRGPLLMGTFDSRRRMLLKRLFWDFFSVLPFHWLSVTFEWVEP